MPGFDTIVFDLDGTLLDTLEDLHLTLNHALSSCGLAPRSFEETRRFVGNGIRRLVEQAVGPTCDPETCERAFDEFNRHYARHCNDHTRPYPGILKLVDELRDEGRQVAVVSNKSDYAVQDLVKAYFPRTFDAVLGVREGLARKPARDMVDAALAQMGGSARAVYVGDSEVDLACAQNAQLPCISVAWGFRTTEELARAGATQVARTAAELGRLLRAGGETGA